MDTPFTNIGMRDVGLGSKLFQVLKVLPHEMDDPQTFGKIKEIADFVGNHPDPHKVLGICRNNMNPNMNNTDYMLGYIRLNQRKQEMMQAMDKMDSEINKYHGM